MLGAYILTVLATLLWGLWFLYFPAVRFGKSFGLKVKHIILIITISLIPVLNLFGFFLSFLWIFIDIVTDGMGSVFPKYSWKKLEQFLNYEFFKKQ